MHKWLRSSGDRALVRQRRLSMRGRGGGGDSCLVPCCLKASLILISSRIAELRIQSSSSSGMDDSSPYRGNVAVLTTAACAAAALTLIITLILVRMKQQQLKIGQQVDQQLRKLKLPPSPPSLPIIGHIHLIGKKPHHSMLQLARRYGSLVFLRLGQLNVLIVSSPAAAKQLLRTQDPSFATKPEHLEAKYLGYGGAGIIFAQYGDHWRRVRKLCSMELLSPKRVEMARPSRRAEMSLLLRDLLQSSSRGEAVDLASKLSDFTFNVMIKMVAGKTFSGSAASRDEGAKALGLKEIIIEFVKEGTGMHIATFFPWLKWADKQVYKLAALFRRSDRILQDEVDNHRRAYKPGQEDKDFIDVMLSMSQDGNGFSDASLKSLAADMIAASTDTGSITSEWAISELLLHPQEMRKVQEELDRVIGRERVMEESDISSLRYLRCVVNETLRLHPPVPIFPRENWAPQPCAVGGEYAVPARTRVFINAYAIGRDETVWKDAERFNPERFMQPDAVDVVGQDFELLPFGAGRRMCPGMHLGLINVMLMVGSLVHAFSWHVPDGHRLDMEEHFGMTVARASPLIAAPLPRLSAQAYN